MYDCPDNRPCLNESAIEDLQATIAKLVYFITSGQRYERRNPYFFPVVENSLKELLRSMGMSDVSYLDAMDAFRKTFPEIDLEGVK